MESSDISSHLCLGLHPEDASVWFRDLDGGLPYVVTRDGALYRFYGGPFADADSQVGPIFISSTTLNVDYWYYWNLWKTDDGFQLRWDWNW